MSAPRLDLSPTLWQSMVAHLRRQGAGVRESGGFFLGETRPERRVATRFLPYEQLQRDALNADFVQLSAASFGRLWDYCAQQKIGVVADVHTHRFGAGQSLSDSENPMVAIAGHIALIVPHFAQGSIRLPDVGLYVYQGAHRWQRFRGDAVVQVLTLREELRA